MQAIITYFKLRENQNVEAPSTTNLYIITYFKLRENQNAELFCNLAKSIITYFKLRENQNQLAESKAKIEL